MTRQKEIATVDEIIGEARNGRMFILVDDKERENEGDLVIPAQMATPEAINFMAKYGRGLICLTMTPERLRELDLPLMTKRNASRHDTAFTVSIEAKEGVTTGISASDRARTIAVAIDPTKGADDIVSPGHVFPLEARHGGVLVRAGHTEATIDLSRLAGLNPSCVICEIMNEDGTMARMPDLQIFAKTHGLKIGTIEDLIAYRLQHDRTIERAAEGFLFDNDQVRIVVYRDQISDIEHVALVKGKILADQPILVRMHTLNIIEDLFRGYESKKRNDIETAMKILESEQQGIFVLIRQPHRASLSNYIKNHFKRQDRDIGEEVFGELRDYGAGAQILRDLGVRKMILLSNNQRNIIGIEGYGLSVVDQRPISSDNAQDEL